MHVVVTLKTTAASFVTSWVSTLRSQSCWIICCPDPSVEDEAVPVNLKTLVSIAFPFAKDSVQELEIYAPV